jgi:hypothetical protein
MATLKDLSIGIEIFAKYKGWDSHSVEGHHDVLCGPEAGEVKEWGDDDQAIEWYEPYDDDMKKLTADDRQALLDAGWFIDSDSGHWMHHT